MTERLRVLILGAHLNGSDVGESSTAFKLVKELSKLVELTVLSLECTKGPPLVEQLPDVEVVTWEEPEWMKKNERMRSMIKPNILLFTYLSEKWIKSSLESGRRWDLAHQILPRAPRYPSALRKFDIPYIIGSLGGALPTPIEFAAEVGSARWYTRLRGLDQLRFKYDPFLRESYRRASLVFGVAPYMQTILRHVPIERFGSFLGIGIDEVAPLVDRNSTPGKLKLLHVGRAVRTKGLRDLIRALAHLREYPGVTLTSIGDGEEISICKKEAARLRVEDRVVFCGKLARNEIEEFYRSSDVFVFPSFRESMGGVLFEAMRWGLPVITVRVGGPDYIVDDSCGLKVDLTNPEIMPEDLASEIKKLLFDPKLRNQMGNAGRAKLLREEMWPVKAQKMLHHYRQLVE